MFLTQLIDVAKCAFVARWHESKRADVDRRRTGFLPSLNMKELSLQKRHLRLCKNNKLYFTLITISSGAENSHLQNALFLYLSGHPGEEMFPDVSEILWRQTGLASEILNSIVVDLRDICNGGVFAFKNCKIKALQLEICFCKI